MLINEVIEQIDNILANRKYQQLFSILTEVRDVLQRANIKLYENGSGGYCACDECNRYRDYLKSKK
jgi:hypothetical protein